MSTRSETPLESPELPCRCDGERLRTRSNEYVIAPSRGGGWVAWTEALARLLGRLVTEPAHCIVISQAPNLRYVQLMAGHGCAFVEASGNDYLTGDFRLDSAEERTLAMLGFARPGAIGREDWAPRNWWRVEEHADPHVIAGLVLTTLTAVMGFDERYPVAIEVFGADRPCESCFWELR